MKSLSIRRILLAVLLTLGTQYSSFAQLNSTIDEVVWVVGDEAIFRSEVEKMRQQMQRVSGNPYCTIPENLALQKLFLHQAKIDSIEVPAETVNRYVEMYINECRFQGEAGRVPWADVVPDSRRDLRDGARQPSNE